MTDALPPYVPRVDPRDLKSGRTVADRNGYYDSQNVVVVHDLDGSEVLSVVYHHSENRKGGPGLRLWSVRSRDGGRTWSRPIQIDSPERQSHDGYQLAHRRADGTERIIVFYGWNQGSQYPAGHDPALPPLRRTDMQLDEGYWLKVSDDAGASWGEQRWSVPVRRTRIDRDNPWGGTTMGMFLCDKPSVIDGAVWMAFQKTVDGAGETPGSEVFFLRSPNLLSVDDLDDAVWETLPDGDVGLQAPGGDLRLGEEPHVLAVSDAQAGRLLSIWRTEVGRLAAAYSNDEGHSWEPPHWLTFDGAHEMKNPRGSFTPFRLRADGPHAEYLMLFYANGRTERLGYVGRRVYWLTYGRGTDDGTIRWSQPEIALYWDGTGFEDRPDWNPDWAIVDGPGYADFAELDDGTVAFVESNKLAVRLHTIEPRLLAALRAQDTIADVSSDSVVDTGPGDVAAAVLPDLRARGGFSLAVLLRGARPVDATLVSAFSNVTAALGEEPTDLRIDKGYSITVEADGEVQLFVTDGFATSFTHRTTICAACGLWDGRDHMVTFVVDGGPKLVSVVVDERLDDGGGSPQGWAFVPAGLGEVGGSDLTVTDRVVRHLVFDRPLLTTEAIGLGRALRSY